MVGVLARMQQGSCRTAQRGGPCVVELDALSCQSVKYRHLDRAAVTGKITRGEIVGQNEDDVGVARRLGCGRRDRQSSQQGQEHGSEGRDGAPNGRFLFHADTLFG